MIGREREKKILDSNSVHNRRGQENSEKNRKKKSKNLKTSFWHYFQPKWDEIGRENDKKNLVPNSFETRPGQENSEKNSKKNRKN